ncbi:glycosyltransferase [Haloferula sp. A504]|uniref:glycosyltransferase n=1 Tax=Haloferula sp. A504 TaxID=3373601 RepID=UPI0037BE64D8
MAVKEAWQRLAGEHVVHIPAALPWAKHKPVSQEEARRKLDLPVDETICLFFGTHRETKDYDTAVRAAAESRSEPFLLFVGPVISGNDPALLASTIDYPKLESRSGYFPDSQVPLLFDAADAVMLPYMGHYTKGSAVLLQASHYQKPVIATKTGHLQDFVEQNRSGMLYEPGSAADLARCYDRISALRDSAATHSEWSFGTVRENYSWDGLLPRYLEIFRKP